MVNCCMGLCNGCLHSVSSCAGGQTDRTHVWGALLGMEPSVWLAATLLSVCRKDMLDEALLRPGRLEVQVEIGLADEKGRHQILKVGQLARDPGHAMQC